MGAVTAPLTLEAGRPWPLGAHWDGRGVNFALFSAHAEAVELCIFDGDTMRTLPVRQCSDQVWHAYLAGAAPGLFDIHAWTVPWFTRASVPGANELYGAFPRMAAWEQRVAGLGEGRRVDCTPEEAFDVAKANWPGLWPGQPCGTWISDSSVLTPG